MTILDAPPAVVAPAPPAAPTHTPGPTSPPAPAPAADRRRSRVPVVATAVLAAAALALGLWAPWSSGPALSDAPAQTDPPSYVQVAGTTPHSVVLHWNPPLTNEPVLGYVVIRNGMVGDLLMPVQQTYSVTGLAAGRTYQFEVVAVYAHALSKPSPAFLVTTR